MKKGQRKIHLALSVENIEFLDALAKSMDASMGRAADYVLSAARSSTSGSMAVLSSSSSVETAGIARSPASQ